MPVASNAQFTQVALNWDTACGVTTLGEVYCWGNNADSVAGQPDVAVATAPVKVQLSVRVGQKTYSSRVQVSPGPTTQDKEFEFTL